MKTAQEKKEEGWDVTTSNHIFSPAYLYNQLSTNIENAIDESSALNIMINQGCATLDLMPYNELDCATKPTVLARTRAARYKASSVKTLTTIDAIKTELINGNPVVFGVPVYDDLCALNAANDTYDTATGTLYSHHEMTLVGYDDNKSGGAFKFVNSSGTSWGLNGYGWISYDFLMAEGYGFLTLVDKANGLPCLGKKIVVEAAGCAAQEIGVGANGTAFKAANSTATYGGYISKYISGTSWNSYGGGASSISVDGQGKPWCVNKMGDIFQIVNGSWQKTAGTAQDIGVGTNGTVCITGTTVSSGGGHIYEWADSNNDGIKDYWKVLGGRATRIDVDASGKPWVVNAEGHIYQWVGAGWQERPGLVNSYNADGQEIHALDIGVGNVGSAYVISNIAVTGGYKVFSYNVGENSWYELQDTNGTPIGGVKIDVQGDCPWIVKADGTIVKGLVKNVSLQYKGNYGADIGVGANGTAFKINTYGSRAINGGDMYKYRSGITWDLIGGKAVNISVDADGNPWCVNKGGDIFQMVNNSWQQIPGTSQDIGIGANGSIWATCPSSSRYICQWVDTDADGVKDSWKRKASINVVKIDVDAAGNPWTVSVAGCIQQLIGSTWKSKPGLTDYYDTAGTQGIYANDIGVGDVNCAYVVSTVPVAGGYRIYSYNAEINAWYELQDSNGAPIGGVRIDVQGNSPWIVQEDGTVLKGTIQ